MAEVIPFRGLRYTTPGGDLTNLIAPPYDIISPAQREALLARSPENIIRVEWGRDEPGDGEAANKYRRGAAALKDWTARGVLRRDDAPAFYVTEHAFKVDGVAGVRRGLLGALRLYPEGSDQVLPHERTIPKDRADRMSLLTATRTNTSPIFGMVDDADGRLALAIAAAMHPESLVEDFAIDDEHHRVWRLDDPAAVAALGALLAPKRVYLADGHHRYETARAYLEEERAAGRHSDPGDPAAFVLAFICSLTDGGLRIFVAHRVVQGGLAALKAAAQRSFEPAGAEARITLVHDGVRSGLRPRADLDRSAMPAAWHGIPIAEAETFLVDPARAAGATVTYNPNTAEAAAAARGDVATVLVAPVDGATIKRISDLGERLPQKTTYFYPKVPAGLVLRPLD